MDFLVDEDLSWHARDFLRERGHYAVHVVDVGLRSMPDESIADYAKAQRLRIVTADKGFTDIRNYPPADYFGIVVLRANTEYESTDFYIGLLDALLGHEELVAQLSGKLAIVSSSGIRIRTK